MEHAHELQKDALDFELERQENALELQHDQAERNLEIQLLEKALATSATVTTSGQTALGLEYTLELQRKTLEYELEQQENALELEHDRQERALELQYAQQVLGTAGSANAQAALEL